MLQTYSEGKRVRVRFRPGRDCAQVRSGCSALDRMRAPVRGEHPTALLRRELRSTRSRGRSQSSPEVGTMARAQRFSSVRVYGIRLKPNRITGFPASTRCSLSFGTGGHSSRTHVLIGHLLVYALYISPWEPSHNDAYLFAV